MIGLAIMVLEKSTAWFRLKYALDAFNKAREENKDKWLIDKLARRVKHYQYAVERLNTRFPHVTVENHE